MKIGIVAPGGLPVPASSGGAVETLIDVFIEYELGTEDQIIVVSGVQQCKANTYFEKNNVKYYQEKAAIEKKALLNRMLKHFNPNIDYEVYLKAAINRLKNEKCDCILVENRPLFIEPIARACGVPTILHLHNDSIPVYGKKNRPDLDRYCSRVIVVSNYIRKCIERDYSSVPVSVVHNGIALDKFKKERNESMRALIRDKFGISANDIVITFTGRFTKEKGVLELVDAYSRIRTEKPILLLIIGASWFGENKSSEYIEKVKTFAARTNNPIKFTGYLSHDKVAEVESISDIAVIPSTWEDPFPLTVLEALASGMPVITTNSGGIPEALDSETGFVLSKEDDLVISLTDKLTLLIEDETLRKTMGNNARKRAEKFFGDETYCKHIRNAIALDVDNAKG